MTSTLGLMGLLVLAVIFGWGVRNGFVDAAANQTRLVRDDDVCQEAERGERGLYGRRSL